MKALFFLILTFLLPQWYLFAQGNSSGCRANIDAKPSDDFIMTEFSGNPQLDNFLNREVNILRRFFETNPSVYYYQDEPGAENAQAMSRVENYSYPSGTVILGVHMVTKEFGYSTSGTTIPFVLAHEFAHIVDFNNDITTGYETRIAELFADFQAGCFLYFRSFLTYTDIRAALQSFYLKGDYEFNNPDHHGTHEERLNAVLAGYNWLKSKARPGVYIGVNDAIEAAKEYLGIAAEPPSPSPQLRNPGTNASTAYTAILSCSSSFCTSLKEVLSGLDDDFKNLRVNQSEGRLYDSKISFPGEQSNMISIGETPSYSYYQITFYRGADIDESTQTYEDLKSNFESLGIQLDEKTSSLTNDDGVIEIKKIRIDLGESKIVNLNWLHRINEGKVSVSMKIGHK
jgi:hypothetical protein